MVDRRIVPDLRWIAQRFPIYVTDGYSGPAAERRTRRLQPLPHPRLRPLQRPRRRPRAAERQRANATPAGRRSRASPTGPSRSRTSRVPPFRWVGYDGDAGHGCGNHLHLSWNHAAGARYQLAEWVEVFPTGTATRPRSPASPRPKQPTAAARRRGPSGGISPRLRTGGVSAPAGGDSSAGRRRSSRMRPMRAPRSSIASRRARSPSPPAAAANRATRRRSPA